jgi:hypothetical protein
MGYKIKGLRDNIGTGNAFDVLDTVYETKEAAVDFIKANLETSILEGIDGEWFQVNLTVDTVKYYYFEIISE